MSPRDHKLQPAGRKRTALDLRASEATLHMARNCLGLRARAVSRAVSRIYDDALRPHGLRATQFLLLGAVQHLGPLPPIRLAEYMAMDKSTMSRNLRGLAERGWIETVPGDGRGQEVRMLDVGRELLLAASEDWAAAQQKAEAMLGAGAAESLRELGSRLLRSENGECDAKA